jgi:hypothetical protein
MVSIRKDNVIVVEYFDLALFHSVVVKIRPAHRLVVVLGDDAVGDVRNGIVRIATLPTI